MRSEEFGTMFDFSLFWIRSDCFLAIILDSASRLHDNFLIICWVLGEAQSGISQDYTVMRLAWGVSLTRSKKQDASLRVF